MVLFSTDRRILLKSNHYLINFNVKYSTTSKIFSFGLGWWKATLEDRGNHEENLLLYFSSKSIFDDENFCCLRECKGLGLKKRKKRKAATSLSLSLKRP